MDGGKTLIWKHNKIQSTLQFKPNNYVINMPNIVKPVFFMYYLLKINMIN